MLLTLCLLLPAPALAAVVTGTGEALVSQSMENDPAQHVSAPVSVLGAYAENIDAVDERRVIRLQFIRPDAKAVSYAVWTLPHGGGYAGTYDANHPGVSLLYYETRPGGSTAHLFVMEHWTGSVIIEDVHDAGNAPFEFYFDCAVRSAGSDGILHTEDDQVRVLNDGFARFDATGDLSGVTYVESGGYYHSSGDVVLVYDDGCSASPDDDYYDDDYYDSGYDDSYESDCDGDVYDDSYDDSSYEDSSCDYEDSGDSDWDWGGDDYDDSDYLVRPMSWAASLGRMCKGPLRRPLRILPLMIALGIVMMLRRYSGRRRKENARPCPAS